MKKISALVVIFIIVFSMFSMFAPQIKAEGSLLEVDPFNYQGTYVINTTELSSREKTALSFVQKYAIKYAISPALIMAITKQESNFNPKAIGDGGLAIGYMQLHWDAAYDAGYRSARGDSKEYAKEDWSTDGLDPDTNIKYGCGYLKICYDKHKDSPVYSDPLKNTISAYNLGWPHGPDKSNESSYVNPMLKNYENYWRKYYSGVEPDWPAGEANIRRHPWDGFIDFEDGTDEAVIRSTIPGLEFTTTLGLDWIYGDIRTGKYNVYPYGHQGYETNGNFFAWLGVSGDQGRIDFPKGTATYLSVLVSTYSGVKIDAYNAEDNFLATSGWAENNLHTRTFTRLTVEVPGMAYVIVHDTGNYWLIDDLCTDAPGVPRAHYEAAELAKAVVGAPYAWGAKGWSIDDKSFLEAPRVKTEKYRYYYWDANERKTKIGYGPGLDCSGLIFWAYNKAYGATKYIDSSNPVYYEGADGQYRNNFKEDINENELLPGDLLFFDWDGDGCMDHVAMYVGPNEDGNDVVHASSVSETIVWAKKDDLKKNGFVGFRRLTEPKVGAEFKSYSPVDLIVTDPDGFTINKEIHEIPGVLYYSEWDIDGNGDLDDMVIVPERKIGDYLITVVPEPEASPTGTYCLEVSADGETVVLAENVQIGDVPAQPYKIISTETGIIVQYYLTVKTDPEGIATIPGEGWYDPCTWVNLTAPLESNVTVKYLFAEWTVNSAQYLNNSIKVHMDGPKTATAVYKDYLGDAKEEIEALRTYVTDLDNNGKIGKKEYNHFMRDLDKVEKDIDKAIKNLDKERAGYDDKMKGFEDLRHAVMKLKHMIKDVQDWAKKGKIPASNATWIISELEAIRMKLVSKARAEALAERALALKAIEDAKAKGKDTTKAEKEIAKVDRELAKAEQKIAEGKLSQAIQHFKHAFAHSHHAIKKAYDPTWTTDYKDWIDELEEMDP